jgi:hypothetical protein
MYGKELYGTIMFFLTKRTNKTKGRNQNIAKITFTTGKCMRVYSTYMRVKIVCVYGTCKGWQAFAYRYIPGPGWQVYAEGWQVFARYKECSGSGCFWVSGSASGAVIYLYGSGSFDQQAKNEKKSWFLLFCHFCDICMTCYFWRMK